MLAASVGTAPALLILVLWDIVAVRLTSMPSSMMSLGFMSAPLLFPFVVIGTILSFRRSVMIRIRPLVIVLSMLSVAATGLVSAYWFYILTHGFMG
jgi:uncharacterized membrane protein